MDRDLAPRSLAVATWALFAGLALVICGVGLFGTIVGIRSELNGFSDVTIGIIGAAYYAGFLVGSRLTLRGLNNVGHIRVFSAVVSMHAAVILVAGFDDTPWLWIVTRFLSGVMSAAIYVVAESWLNGLATNRTRGRLLAIYLVVTGAAFGLGQLMVGWVRPDRLTAFAVGAVLTALAVAPVALSEAASAPPVADDQSISLRQLVRTVPTGVGAGLLVGLTHGAMVSLAVVYATQLGLSAGAAGLFAAVGGVGGVLGQWPLSAASDQLDRRYVGTVTALAATAGCLWLLVAGPAGWQGLASMAIIGMLSLPLYSIAAAYTSDWVNPEHLSAASSRMVQLYGVGALIGPFAAALVMAGIGPDGLPWALAVGHALIAAFLGYRMFAWREPIAKRPWSEATISARAFFIPANVVWAGQRLGRTLRRR